VQLAFQLISSTKNLPRFLEQASEYLASVADDDTEVKVYGTSRGALADNYRVFKFLDTYEILQQTLTRGELPDALVIANALDVGMFELREVFDFPVLGYLQTNLALANLRGEHVALLVPSEGFVPRFAELVTAYGFERSVRSIVPLDFGRISDLDSLFGPDGGSYLDRIVRSVSEQVSGVGADAILPCGPPTLYLSKAGVQRIGGARVIDGYLLVCKAAEMLARLNASGLYAWRPDGDPTSMPEDLRVGARTAFAQSVPWSTA
jgi:Asp/Glu/hydantoin racemase